MSISCDVAWADSDLIANLEAALEDSATSNSASESFCVLTWFVYIERADDNHVRWHGELTSRDGNSAQKVNHNINVVLQLGGNWNNRSRASRPSRE